MGGIFASEAVVAPIVERGQELMFFTYSAHPGEPAPRRTACCRSWSARRS